MRGEEHSREPEQYVPRPLNAQEQIGFSVLKESNGSEFQRVRWNKKKKKLRRRQ